MYRFLYFLTICFVLPEMAIVMINPATFAAETQRPNIVFLLADDQRNDTLGCAHHPILQTPHIDQLAKEGTRFENAFVTTSICAASRATLFTGLYERSHRFTFRTPPIQDEHARQSYPYLLRQSGYRTGFVGKFGVRVSDGLTQQMFEYFKPHGRSPYFKTMPDGTFRHEVEIAGDQAIEFLQTCRADQPFCLSVSFNAVHAEDSDKINHYPWPKVVDGLYEDVEIALPKLRDPTIFESQPEFLKKSLNRERWFWRWDTPEKYARNMRAYFRMISGVDHVVGRIRQAVQNLGLADNTIVIFSADNGYYQGNRGFAGKWSHYEESLRVPLIVFDPRNSPKQAGQVTTNVALNVDIPATVLGYAGVDIPAAYQGASLQSWVQGDEVPSWRKDFFCEHLMELGTRIPKWEGVRSNRFVYARYFEQAPRFEFLHDLQTDPDQLINLVGKSEHAETLAQFRDRCDTLRTQLGGVFTPNAPPVSD